MSRVKRIISSPEDYSPDLHQRPAGYDPLHGELTGGPQGHVEFPDEPSPLRAPKKAAALPVRVVGLRNGGILDVDTFTVGNIGNSVQLAAPTSLFSAVASSVLWGGKTVAPPAEASRTPILQARAISPSNPQGLLVNINAPDIANTLGNAPNIDLKLKFQQGVGGNLNEFFIDVVQGQQIVIPATHVTVEGFYTILDANAPFPSVRLGVSLAYGAHSSGGTEPSFTQRIFSVPSTGSVITAIPPFARNLTIYSQDDATGRLSEALLIQWLTSSAGGGLLGVFSQAANTVPILPVPGGANALQITNTSAPGATSTYTLRYGLGL